MEFLSDTVVLSRMQFALTALFHMLWPTLTTEPTTAPLSRWQGMTF